MSALRVLLCSIFRPCVIAPQFGVEAHVAKGEMRRKPHLLTAHLAAPRFGVEATLDEVFDAPPLVKHVLKDEASIHETYVGGRSGLHAPVAAPCQDAARFSPHEMRHEATTGRTRDILDDMPLLPVTLTEIDKKPRTHSFHNAGTPISMWRRSWVAPTASALCGRLTASTA